MGARGHAVWGAGGGAVLRACRLGARGHAVWGAGWVVPAAEVPTLVKAVINHVLNTGYAEVLFCELDGWVLGGMQFGVLVEVLFCELDGWVLGGMQFGVLVEV